MGAARPPRYVVDFVRQFSTRTALPIRWVLGHLRVRPTQFYRSTRGYGRVNTHNGLMPRDHWLTSAERQAILDYARPRIISDNGPQFIAKDFKDSFAWRR